MTLKALGDRIGGMDYAAVSMGIRRFERRLIMERELKQQFNRIVRMLDVKT